MRQYKAEQVMENWSQAQFYRIAFEESNLD